jgi:hypothetical protein
MSQPTPADPQLPAGGRSRWPWLAAAAGVALAAGIVIAGVTVDGGSDGSKTVRIGVADASQP